MPTSLLPHPTRRIKFLSYWSMGLIQAPALTRPSRTIWPEKNGRHWALHGKRYFPRFPDRTRKSLLQRFLSQAHWGTADFKFARRAIESVLLYKPLKSLSHNIFMAAAHRGPPLADRQLVTRISSIIRLPKTLITDLATATLNEITKSIQQGGQTRAPQTSIGTLSPNYKPYKALEASPFRPGLVYNLIIGDRGKGDGNKGSDGIIAYWSSPSGWC